MNTSDAETGTNGEANHDHAELVAERLVEYIHEVEEHIEEMQASGSDT